MGFFSKKSANKKKSNEELKAEVFRKASAHLDSENAGAQYSAENNSTEKGISGYKNINQIKKKNIRTVLLEIAERGDAGVLSVSISDKHELNLQDTSSALAFLVENSYVEAVNSRTGMKYYLTDAGRKHCISKEFNTGVQ